MRRKVCVVITARPSYSRIKTALKAIKDNPDLELQVVIAASALLDRYGTAVDVIEKDGFEDCRPRLYGFGRRKSDFDGKNYRTRFARTGDGFR